MTNNENNDFWKNDELKENIQSNPMYRRTLMIRIMEQLIEENVSLEDPTPELTLLWEEAQSNVTARRVEAEQEIERYNQEIALRRQINAQQRAPDGIELTDPLPLPETQE